MTLDLFAAPLYGGLLGLLAIFLSYRVTVFRRAHRAAFGSKGDELFTRAVRVHGNFAEYVPLGLVLLLVVELGGAPDLVLHAVGASLLAGRVAHAWGVSRSPEPLAFRVAGMGLTYLSLALGSLAALGLVFI